MAISSAQPADSASSHASRKASFCRCSISSHPSAKCVTDAGSASGVPDGAVSPVITDDTADPAIPASTASPLKTGSPPYISGCISGRRTFSAEEDALSARSSGEGSPHFSVWSVSETAFSGRAAQCCPGSVSGAEISGTSGRIRDTGAPDCPVPLSRTEGGTTTGSGSPKW
ncbi:hypothetical protein HmCmsJML281_02549 [Escherichia coli]|nr:hypothetical protein HmCmsJML281_02549 [Escherichia coli]